MERPAITVDNHQAVYDYFSQNELPTGALKIAHSVINRIFDPRVTMAPGAQSDLERIRDEQIPHIYIFNHLSRFDWFIFASTLHQIAPSDVGNVRTMGADFNFHLLKTKGKFWVGGGTLNDHIGGIPVFRSIDYPKRDLTPVQENLFNCVVRNLERGQAAAAAPEGKINETDDPATLLPFRSGIIEIGQRAANSMGREVAYTPLGTWFGQDRHKKPKIKNVSVYTGRSLFVPPGSGKIAVTDHARNSLQFAVTIARELY
jgi:1-acyl-sn-glycerol-3-phosphate acyltransferase